MGERLKLLSISKLSKQFHHNGKTTNVLDGIDFDINEGDFISIFGPNGCGKTTLLNIVAGIIPPSNGAIYNHSDGANHTYGIVFQNYDQSLLPWRTCLENIALPLESQNTLSYKERIEQSKEIVNDLSFDLPLDSYPYQMSGGQKQLTCIARAMISHPTLLILDEPFASLDYQSRYNMQNTIQEIWEKTGVTILFVSHEIDEAIFLADRLILLTQRPATIHKVCEIPFSRPRDLKSLTTDEFTKLKAALLQDFHNMVSE